MDRKQSVCLGFGPVLGSLHMAIQIRVQWKAGKFLTTYFFMLEIAGVVHIMLQYLPYFSKTYYNL
jgi:hypothetical protein